MQLKPYTNDMFPGTSKSKSYKCSTIFLSFYTFTINILYFKMGTNPSPPFVKKTLLPNQYHMC